MTDDDAELVALIDNELDEGSGAALLERLGVDKRLRQRYEELWQTTSSLAASFDALLGQAPVARLRAALPADEPVRRRSMRFSGFAVRELAAGVMIGLLVAGAVAWAASVFGLLGGKEDWRTAIAEYTHLYTNETFSPFNPDAAMQAAELNVVGPNVGASLTPENVALPGLRFTTAFMLSYGDDPLGVIAYVDPSGGPVLLCILADRASDAPIRSERRADLSLAWWSRSGRTHLVIGRITEDKAVTMAKMLEKRV